MKYLIGLGNNGPEFTNSRHNTGFMFVDFLLAHYPKERIVEKKLKTITIFEINIQFSVAKPHGYMNESGNGVRELVNWFKVDIEKEIIVAHDDLDIPLGKYKLQFARSPRTHNGVLSVENALSTKNFYRLRFGVDNRTVEQIPGDQYVLEQFNGFELETINKTFEAIDMNEILAAKTNETL